MSKYRPPVAKPCSDCPFRRKAMPGWLGAGSPESFIDCMQRDEPLPCHQTIDYDNPHWLVEWMHQKNGNMCAGALTFLANKLQQHPFVKVGKDHENVFSNSVEFVRHHREAAVHSWDDDTQNEGAKLHHMIISSAAERMGQPIINFKNRKDKKSVSKAKPKTPTKSASAKTSGMSQQTEDAIKDVEHALGDLAGLKIPVEEYVEALEEIFSHVEAQLVAARDDIERKARK